MKTETAATTPLKVLLVEDFSADKTLIVRELQKAGNDLDWLRVEPPVRLKEALIQNSFDIVISDYHFLPFTALDVLSVTHSPKRDLNERLALGAVEFIQRPIASRLLIEKMESVLAQRPEQQE